MLSQNFILMYFGKNLFLPAKTVFPSSVFTTEKLFFSTDWQKPANRGANHSTIANHRLDCCALVMLTVQ